MAAPRVPAKAAAAKRFQICFGVIFRWNSPPRAVILSPAMNHPPQMPDRPASAAKTVALKFERTAGFMPIGWESYG